MHRCSPWRWSHVGMHSCMLVSDLLETLELAKKNYWRAYLAGTVVATSRCCISTILLIGNRNIGYFAKKFSASGGP